MGVRWDQPSSFDRMLNDGETATGLVAPHLEVDSHSLAELNRPTFTRTDNQQTLFLNDHGPPLEFARHLCILIARYRCGTGLSTIK
jgi:hypothetical protein